MVMVTIVHMPFWVAVGTQNATQIPAVILRLHDNLGSYSQYPSVLLKLQGSSGLAEAKIAILVGTVVPICQPLDIRYSSYSFLV